MGHGNIGHGRGLTRDEAEARARLLSDVRYQVEVDLTGPSSELFGSVATVRFACAEPGAATFLDLGARSVESMELTGRPLPADACDSTASPPRIRSGSPRPAPTSAPRWGCTASRTRSTATSTSTTISSPTRRGCSPASTSPT